MFVNPLPEQQDSNLSYIQIAGELNISNIQLFKDQICRCIDNTPGGLCIDCANLTYIDSQGLNLLVWVLKKMKTQQRDLYLANTNDSLDKLLRITSLDKFLVSTGGKIGE